MTTHHWRWVVEVHNEFRNSTGCLHYQWYSPLAIFQESFLVSGPAPLLSGGHRIRVLLRGQEVGSHQSKEGALGQIRALLSEAPASCRDLCQEGGWVLEEAISGGGFQGDG